MNKGIVLPKHDSENALTQYSIGFFRIYICLFHRLKMSNNNNYTENICTVYRAEYPNPFHAINPLEASV